ncbi:MAG: efflux RND transporter permease subunit, partial [Candidatus Latescibacteria bacterium]|nr:efflux RND transporter permease subunit [Candidatus Latescibacterota bacterium]
MTLTGFSVSRPVTTTMFFLALAILGVISWMRLPLQLFPELIFPEVFVTFNLNGASAEQIEREMVIVAEGEIGKLDGVQVMESSCRANSGNIRISYAPDTDMKFALLQLQNRMSRLQSEFPERTRVNVQRFDSSDLSATIMQLNVLGDGDLNWLREFSEEKIRPELEAVEGVVSAQILGGRREAIEIIVDPLTLQAHQLSLTDVRNRLNAANQRRQYLGRVYNGSQALSVSMHEQFDDLKKIGEVVIKPDIPLHLGDIANIRYGSQTQTDFQRVNGKPSIGVRIQKDDEANLIEVSRLVETAIERINKDFASEEIELVISNSQAEMMEGALDTLKQAAMVGGALGLFVLFLFLRNLRFVVVLLLAIPASLLVTFNLMYAWDLSLNVLSLCGLALAVGMLTDNGIVVMENIFKHFELGKSPIEAARQGTEEVSRAVLAATATTVTVFLPVIFIQSDAQDILRELALAMTFPLLASLLVALTLVPALSAFTLSNVSRPPTGTGILLEKYTVLLKAGLRHRAWVTIAVVLIFAGTLGISFFFMLQQDVRQEESQFTTYISLPEGATLEATDAVVTEVESAIRDVPGLKRFLTSVQENQASVTVMLNDLVERPKQVTVDQIKENLDEKLAEIGDAVIGYDAPVRTGRGGGRGGGGGTGRSSGGFNLTGTPQTEQAVIRGHDFSVLQMLADDLGFRLEELEEVIDPNSVRPDVERSASEVQVLPDEAMMFDRQLNVQTVLSTVGDARADGFQTTVPYLTASGLEVAIDVRSVEDPKTESMGLQAFRTLPIISPNGSYVPLNEIAHVRTDQGRSMILRTDQSRRALVSYQFTTEILDAQPALEAARLLIREVVQEMVLPEGYSIEIVEAEEETIYYWMMGIAGLLIYMILASLFESFSAPIVILCTIPTAIVGSCWALILSGTGLTQQEGPMALLGFIVLLGIAVNNGIMLIDAINTLRAEHGFRRERAVIVAGKSRVRPILMTSATTLLGVMPLALTFGGDYEIWPPFAITVLGGLTVSMVSTLIFIPVVYMGLDQVKDWLRDIGLVGIGLGSIATIGSVYSIDNYYQSLFITTLSVVPIWFGFLSILWVFGRIKKSRKAAKKRFDSVAVIQLRNLTKIYGAPGKFRQEWLRFQRRGDRLDAGSTTDKLDTRD